MIRIYIDTDVLSPKVRKRGRTWYRMERELGSGRIELIENTFTFEEHNVDGASLEGILDALKQIDSSDNQAEIFIPSTIIAVQIASGHEFKEARRGFRTRKGKQIKNEILWRGIVKQMVRTCRQIKCGTYSTDELKEQRQNIRFLKNMTFDKARKSPEQVAFSDDKKLGNATNAVNPPNRGECGKDGNGKQNTAEARKSHEQRIV